MDKLYRVIYLFDFDCGYSTAYETVSIWPSFNEALNDLKEKANASEGHHDDYYDENGGRLVEPEIFEADEEAVLGEYAVTPIRVGDPNPYRKPRNFSHTLSVHRNDGFYMPNKEWYDSYHEACAAMKKLYSEMLADFPDEPHSIEEGHAVCGVYEMFVY